LRIVITIDLLI